jgi:hypothetical protein
MNGATAAAGMNRARRDSRSRRALVHRPSFRPYGCGGVPSAGGVAGAAGSAAG